MKDIEVLLPSWHPMDGVVKWKTSMGFTVLRVHHSADPDKDDAWAEEAAKKYPGGRTGKGWRAEMDIDFLARSGRRVYEDFSISSHVRKTFEPPYEWPKFRGIDPGFHNPCACVWMALDGDGCWWVYKEFYKSGWKVPAAASSIKGLTGRDKIEYTVIDSQAFAEDQSDKTIADQFAEEGIFCVPGSKKVEAGISAIASRMMVMDNGEPRFKVMDSCPNTIRELAGYRYRELTETQEKTKDQPETPLKKDDHTCDAIRYVIMATPDDYFRQVGINDPTMRSASMEDRVWKHLERKRQQLKESEEDW